MEVALRLEDGRTLCERCVLADTALARMKGLLGKRGLAADEGILLRPASSVHTGFMRFPIDVVFVDRADRVLKVSERVPPWKVTGARGAKAAVELRAGEAERRGVRVGEKLYVGGLPSGKLKRKLPWGKTATNMLLAVVWLAFAGANLMQWHKTHKPVGLGLMVLELIVAMLFMVRRQAWITSREPMAWFATAVGTFGTLAGRPHYAPALGLEPLYFLLQVGGALASLFAIGFLGRSFGLVAANRGVRTGGPYSWVRHPLYMSYFFAQLGYMLENPSPWNVGLILTVFACQIVRIRTEEDCLRADPKYRRYCERVRYRLVPLVW